METDGRLVEDVEDAHQLAADLGGQPDALALATGEAGRGAVEAEVVEADVAEESEPFADLLERPAGDLHLTGAEVERLGAAQRLRHGEAGEIHDAHPVDGDGEELRLEPLAGAGGARLLHHQPLDLLLDPLRLGLAVAALEIGDHPLIGGLVGVGAPGVRDIAHPDGLVLGQPVEDDPLLADGELAEGDVGGNPVASADGLEDVEDPHLGRPLGPAGERPVVDRERGVAHHRVAIDLHPQPEAGAGRAGAVRVVEGEVPGGGLLHGDAAVDAGVVLGEEHLAGGQPARGGALGVAGPHRGVSLLGRLRAIGVRRPPRTVRLPAGKPGSRGEGGGYPLLSPTGRLIRRDQQDQTVAELRRLLQGVGEPAAQLGTDDHAVDHDLDVVLELLVERDGLAEIPDHAVDPGRRSPCAAPR